ncbi:hypothetical protein [Solemya velesiana gill symbiont]|uniref:hypothetical protein n=1 Tax=Solemya velesiana gill symbiont TaxID=1918948 RepID=UPI001083CE31|nr:hypothetical protein [Solemya velesiana gill symbiont]
MINPINNDKISSQAPATNSTSDGERVERELASDTAPVESAEAPKPTNDTLELSATGQRLNQPPAETQGSTGSIGSSNEANDLVGRLRRQIEQDSAQALTAQGGLNPSQLAAILEAAPA